MEEDRERGWRRWQLSPRFVVWMLAAIIVSCFLGLAQTNLVRKQPQKKAQKETFTRPKPTRPIKPEIPSQDRYVSNKVFLERADSLYHTPQFEDRQIVSGNVMFRQGNMFMYCDSAYYYIDNNSLQAFGHVKMTSGDTLFVYADRMFYDGMQKLARLRNGPTRPKVNVQNRRVTLSSDSLFYSVNMDRGWYDCGGQLEDEVNILTSQYGEYSPSLKTADFFGNVFLRGKKNGNKMYTDTLFYNTSTHIARIVSRTDIYSPHDTIETYNGEYNTQTGYARLNSRSTITHTDSNHNATKLTGDIIIYDKAARLSRAYMFDDPSRARPMVLNDTAHKVRLIADYGEYNDETRSAYATGHPLMVEYSRPDTNYMRADTLYTWIVKHKIEQPYTEEQQILYDSLMQEQKRINAEADSIARVYGINLDNEKELSEREGENPGSEEDEIAIPKGDGVENPEIPRRVDLIGAEPRLKRDSVEKEFSVARAVKHSRFFNQQLQAIADTMLMVQFDSLLYLKRKPIVWSDERQVTGDTIVVHFNDSTADRARVVNGFVGELVDEDFYNQMKGKKMFATFGDSKLKHLLVDDNVEVILLPAEKDSTFNKLIRAESEHLTVDMTDDQKLDKLKMWSTVDGTVTPIFKVQQKDKYLPGFEWHDMLRPKREWYYGRWIWDDELGDVSDEMMEYFKPVDPTETLGKYFGP